MSLNDFQWDRPVVVENSPLRLVPDRDPDVTIPIDCRSEEGVTIGLIDSILTTARVLSKRRLTHPAVDEALKDLHDDADLLTVLQAAKIAVMIPLTGD